ncbi:MAG TPA: hypothetical protein VEY69_07430 [Lautropia sp.]|jgi:hypothetical protein|nr:hypothetical protein [Lautropia sp.]
MSTIRIALLAAGLLAASATVQAQTSPSGGPSPSTRSAPDANKAGSPSGTAPQGVEGSTSTQGGPAPSGLKNEAGGQRSATDPATGHDVEKSTATQGVPAGRGAQGGAQPNKVEDATGSSKEKAKQ